MAAVASTSCGQPFSPSDAPPPPPPPPPPPAAAACGDADPINAPEEDQDGYETSVEDIFDPFAPADEDRLRTPGRRFWALRSGGSTGGGGRNYALISDEVLRSVTRSLNLEFELALAEDPVDDVAISTPAPKSNPLGSRVFAPVAPPSKSLESPKTDEATCCKIDFSI